MDHMNYLDGKFYMSKLQLFFKKNNYKIIESDCCHTCIHANHANRLVYCSMVGLEPYEDWCMAQVDSLGICNKFKRRKI